MTTFDIFNPQISTVAKGLEGKAILIYGSNSTGKTKQATRMKKPFYLGFEDGIRAIAGIPFLAINRWGDFKKINKQLTDPKNIDKAKEMYSTIIFDEVFTAAKYCQDFLCRKHGVETIGDGNNGYGLWTEYANEFWGELDKLLKSGFTLAFIGHEQLDKDSGKIVPKGDVRSMALIRDNCDLIIRLTSNGVDENGRVIKSTAWTAETDEYFARSRFDYMDTVIPEFTAESLEKAVAMAIERQEEAEGITAVSYDEQRESMTSEVLDFDKLKDQVNEIGSQLAENGQLDELLDLVEKHLGKGNKVAEAKPHQAEVLSLLLDDLKELVAQ